MDSELSTPTCGRFVSVPHEVLGAKNKSDLSTNIDVIKALIDLTSGDLQSLLKGLKAECSKDEDLDRVCRFGVQWYEREENSRGFYNQPKVPKEYHVALIAYVLKGFYDKFNEATRNLRSPGEKYPYPHFFKLLLLAVVHVKGHPYELPTDQLLYRGMSGHFETETDSFVSFQHFASTTRNRRTALGYAGPSDKPRTIFIIHGIMTAGSDAGTDLGTPGCPNTICLDHIAAHNEECLIWPCEIFQVTKVVDHSDLLREIHLHA